MGDKSCYMGAGGYSGYMGSGTSGSSYKSEDYAGNWATGPQAKPPPPSSGSSGSGYAGNVGGSDAQASCYMGPK
ncbi:unnamed protein product [Nippostrongylus brasiliensis]|uniref:Uncharacterized protein n=1 Tax=Nippostrongylus brasiliensis TaxID=27835 RepID=A0A0N4YAE8_NIPBR|nr:hypothetical protein Q1695_010882 [Nippostrongylus brasiliensis]VDL76950.1 unnamed protein product [Nippostrongylus brasiliensis]